ncbi:hypothetical protein GGI42DRAFT_10225 [Trichoderma sp. SZMC 28013]
MRYNCQTMKMKLANYQCRSARVTFVSSSCKLGFAAWPDQSRYRESEGECNGRQGGKIEARFWRLEFWHKIIACKAVIGSTLWLAQYYSKAQRNGRTRSRDEALNDEFVRLQSHETKQTKGTKNKGKSRCQSLPPTIPSHGMYFLFLNLFALQYSRTFWYQINPSSSQACQVVRLCQKWGPDWFSSTSVCCTFVSLMTKRPGCQKRAFASATTPATPSSALCNSPTIPLGYPHSGILIQLHDRPPESCALHETLSRLSQPLSAATTRASN